MPEKPTREELLARIERLEGNDVSAAWLEHFFELSMDMMCVAGFDGVVRMVNPAWEKVLGWSARECEGSSWTEFIHPDDLGLAEDEAELVRAGKTVLDLDLRFRARDGGCRWISWNARPLPEKELIFGIGRDVTESRKAKEELEVTRSLLSAAVEQTPAGILIADAPDVRIRVANPAALGIRGSSSSLLVDIPVEKHPRNWQVFHPDGTPFAGEDLPLSRAVLKGEVSRNVEAVIRRPDGEDRWVLANAAPVRDSGGGITAGVVVFTDITERQKVERAFRESEEKFRKIVESSPMGILFYRLEEDGRLVLNGVNPAACGLLKTDLNRSVGLTIEEVFPPLAETEIPDRYREVCRTGVTWHSEEVDYEYGEISGAYEVYAFRTVPSMVAVMFLDITERMRTERALRESGRRLRRIFENVQDIYYETTLDGTVIEMSPSVGEITGYSREELLGNSVIPLYADPSDRDEIIDELRKERLIRDREVMIRDRDGVEHPCRVNAVLVEAEDDSEERIVGAIRDRTESEMLQEQLQQAQKMEAVGTMAGGIAHDFNNILTTILSGTDIVHQTLPEGHEAEATLGDIRKAAENASRLTRQLLAFSRKQIFEARSVDINSIITGIIPLLERLTREKIELSTGLGEMPGWIRADPLQIEQVIINLAMNAVDAMPGGGRLVIESREVSIDRKVVRRHSVVEPGRYVLMTVSDTGHGMDRATAERIFEPFFTTKEPGKGTGLGLSVVYGIVKQHGGRIYAYSEPGEGTTFKVFFPVSEEKGTALAACDAKGKPPCGSEKVLVVEDDATVLDLVSRVLKELGYDVVRAPGAREALAAVEDADGKIDLLLTDVMMPVMNGRVLYERILKIDPSVRVVYMSGYTDNVIAGRGLIDPDVVFIQKPFTMDRLARRIREALDR